MIENIESQFIKVGDIQLHVVFAGPKDGEPIVLLHGFPEFWYGWRNQIPYLAERGFRVIVPDQRGYNLSDKPKNIADYRMGALTTDITALMDVLGYDQFNLVGHDWGAAVAWWIATIAPDRLKKLMILNVPYPSIMAQEVFNGNMSQIFKSWYIGFFQIPVAPEALLSMNDYDGLVKGMFSIGKKSSFKREDFDAYKKAWGQAGALTAMINWYRATIQAFPSGGGGTSQNVRITVPTLMLWGEQDKALGKELAELSIHICDDGELIFFPNASHWIQHDEAETVNQMMITFFSNNN